MRVVSASDIGLVRKENEDMVRVQEFDNKIFAVVCDGMGGENSGGEASRIATDVIFDNFFTKYSDSFTPSNIRNLLLSSISAANSVIYSTAQQDTDKIGMGTTCIIALVTPEIIQLISVGDSRAYFIDDKGIIQITHDHTYVRMLYENGEIDEDDMQSHPKKNMLIRAVGVEKSVKPDYFEIIPQRGFKLIMCSDGLTNYCTDEEIFEAVQNLSLEDASEKLIKSAKSKGGRDNITIAIIADDN